MKKTGLGKRINEARKDRGYTSDKLSELCNINTVYLRQIESGGKMPSLPVFITLCNVLQISPDYLLQDNLVPTENSTPEKAAELWKNASPLQQKLIVSMLQTVLEHKKNP